MKVSSIVAACFTPAVALGSGLTVSTRNGLITGHRAESALHVKEFLGIPYAKPPVGELRFKPPQKYTETKDYTASSFVSSPV